MPVFAGMTRMYEKSRVIRRTPFYRSEA